LAVAAFLNLLGIAICCRIIIPNLVHPTDMYGYDSSLGYRLRVVYHSSLLKYVGLALFAGAAAVLFGRRDMARRDTKDARGIVALGVLLIAAGFYLGWEIFFYDGRLPYGQRYDFPSVMIFPVLAGAGFYAALEVRKRSAWTQKHFSLLALQFCFVLLMLNAAVFAYVHGRLLPILHSVAVSNSHTQNMVRDLEATRALTSPHPDWMILVVPGRPIDYETVVMIPTWFHFYEISNPASLFVDIPPQKIVTTLDHQLLQNLQWVSTHGDKALQFVPTTAASVASAEAQGHCYIVTLEDTKSPCTRLPYRPEAYFPE